jgi:hypothetical protein
MTWTTIKTEYDMNVRTTMRCSGIGRRNRVLITLVLGFAASLGFVATKVWAADSIQFTETVKDQVACVTNQGVEVCGPRGFGRFTIDAKVSLAGVYINQFNAETLLYINVGDFTFSGLLGADPNYMAGKRKATIVQSHMETGLSKPVTDLQVGLTWNWKEVRIHITGNPSARYRASVFRNQVVEEGIVNGSIQPAISFGDVMGLFDVTVVGNAKKQSITTTNGVVNLFDVKIKGKGVPAGF